MSKSNRWDRWIYPLSKDVDTTFCLAVTAVLSKSGPYSAHLGELVVKGRLVEVIEYKIPVSGISLEDFRSATQIRALFQKNKDLDLGFNPRKAAVEACIKAELQCRRVNEYFGALCPFSGVVSVISLARRKIRSVLGSVPTLQALKGRLGPGASTRVKRSEACPEGKLSSPVVCSEEMLPYVDLFLAETPRWAEYHSEFVSSSITSDGDLDEIDWRSEVPVTVDPGKLIFVDKNAKTDRPICVEPALNGFWQLGVGDYIKDRLRIRAGQDLKDQQRNQLLAREGSMSGNLATIDLSSASDTLAFSVVFDLLPEDWVDLLSKLRTGTISYAGHEYELEKFSSMGNGFTFELESLIFWALAASATELRGEDTRTVSVYGDDIIVPTGAVDLLNAALVWCGFNVNNEKSFWTGPFRESCGADWLSGEDVRPIFKKDRLSYQTLFVFHNWAMRRGERELASIAVSFIPKEFQLSGPDGYGDGHLLGSYDLRTNRELRRAGWEGGYFYTLREASKSVETDEGVSQLAGLYALYSRGPSDHWDPRDPYRPGITPGTHGVERTSIYTFTEHIFIR